MLQCPDMEHELLSRAAAGRAARARVLAATQLLASRATARRGCPRPLRLVLLSVCAADLELSHLGDRNHPVKLHRPIHLARSLSNQIELPTTFATLLRTQCAPQNVL